MNFLEIINKCLVELNYKKVNAFAELTKNEHKKIMNILNVINAEVCNYTKWNFLIRKAVFILNAGCAEIDNSVNGRISQLIVDGKAFDFYENAGDILIGKVKNKSLYSTYDKKILFAKVFDERNGTRYSHARTYPHHRGFGVVFTRFACVLDFRG